MNQDQRAVVPTEILLYQTEDGQTRIEVRMQDRRLAFGKRMVNYSRRMRTISEHIQISLQKES